MGCIGGNGGLRSAALEREGREEVRLIVTFARQAVSRQVVTRPLSSLHPPDRSAYPTSLTSPTSPTYQTFRPSWPNWVFTVSR